MTTLAILSHRVGVAEDEIISWVERAWLVPDGAPGGWTFREVDVARVRLIVELRALHLDDDAMPVVLSLLDQLHATRRRMRLLLQAVEECGPDPIRVRLRALIEAE